MAEVVLFHHALGLTPGLRELADELRETGHTVHLPDLFEGRTFDTVDEGVAHAREIGFETVMERGRAAAAELPAEVVYWGVSLGVVPAQLLAQTRPGARGALLVEACIPPEEFGGSWPEGVPAQVHVAEDDELGDVDVAREFASEVEDAELFLYPGDRHLFTDPSLEGYDAAIGSQFRQRVAAFLGAVDAAAA